MDHVLLIGTEDVRIAGRSMQDAADRIERAAASIADSNERLMRALEDHATRIEDTAKETT